MGRQTHCKSQWKKVKISSGDYIILDRIWKSGDKVELTLPMSLHVERVKGNDSLGAIFYGPVLLAGELGTDGIESPAPTSNPSLYNDYYTYDYKIPDGLNHLSGFPERCRNWCDKALLLNSCRKKVTLSYLFMTCMTKGMLFIGILTNNHS